MVPQACDIDISKYARTPSNSSACITPSMHNRYVKKPASVRRKKNPVVLNLDKISMSLSDDEEGDAPLLTVAHTTRKSKLIKQKLVKRKIFEEDLSDDASSIFTWRVHVPTMDTKSTNGKTRNNTQADERSTKDMHKVAISVPDIGPNLVDLMDKEVPATTGNLEKSIEEIEKLKINSGATRRTRKVKATNQLLTVADHNKNVNRATALLKDLVISEETDVNIDSKVETLNGLPVQNEKTSEKNDGRSSTTLTVKTLKQSTDNASTSSISKSKTTRCRPNKLLVNNEVIGVRTRSSLRKTKEKPS